MTATIPVLTAAAMREADARAVRAGVPVEQLMEAAAAGTRTVMEQRYGDLLGYRIAIVCGRGNNGGDGLALARLLAERGAVVEAAVIGTSKQLDGLPLTQATAARRAGIPLHEWTRDDDASRALGAGRWDYVVDALLGTGSRGEPRAEIASAALAIRDARDRGTRVISLDLPTGVDADTARPAKAHVVADLTVTFGALKRAHVLHPGRALCGHIDLVDIGIPADAYDGLEGAAEMLTPATAAALLPYRAATAHKGTAGRALVIGGALGMSGAVALAGESALRAGAGLVTAAIPKSTQPIVASLCAEMVTQGIDDDSGVLAMSSVPRLLELASAARAVGIGPGLGRSENVTALVAELLRGLDRPVVIDADGLEALARHGEEWREIPRHMPVLTPHLGEMSRLTGITADSLESERIDAAARWAKQWNAIVLMKGAPTVIAAPDGRITVNATGNEQMASAGMGDVLTGCVVGFLAQGLNAYDATRLAAYVHGRAADRLVERRGAAATLAGEVARELSNVIGALRGASLSSPLPEHVVPRTSAPSEAYERKSPS